VVLFVCVSVNEYCNVVYFVAVKNSEGEQLRQRIDANSPRATDLEDFTNRKLGSGTDRHKRQNL